MTCYIGIDLGTTGCKTVMFSEEGRILSEFNKEYNLIFKGDYVEQDANEWWRLVCEGISFVTKDTGIGEVSGISVSTQSISFVPVDEKGNTLYNAISWLDVRADRETEKLIERFGEDKIYSVTGKPCLCDYSLPKLMWFYENEREIYDKAYKILFPLDFLNFKMCKKAVTDYSVAGGSMLYDIHNMRWSEELSEFSHIDINKLPEVGSMGDYVGLLDREVCEKCGVCPGCKVFLGGQDQKLAALGAGIEKNTCTVSIGTATAISKRCERGIGASPLFRFDRDSYISETALMTTGSALRWIKTELFSDTLSYRDIDSIVENTENGSNGVVFDYNLSQGGSVTGITLSTVKGNIVYALYEAVSKDIKAAVDEMGGAECLKVFGGGSKSGIWCRILADTVKIPVHILKTSETASLGAAILASEGVIPPARVKEIM